METIDVTSGQVTGTGTTTITINPSADLENGTTYYVQIDATAFDDAASNSYAGISDSTTWNFTTPFISSSVNVYPQVVEFFPSDNAIDVNVNTQLRIQFDQSIAFKVGGISIIKADTGELVEKAYVHSESISGCWSKIIRVELAEPLEYETDYYINVDSSAFKNNRSNRYSGISDSTTWNFTTEAGSGIVDEILLAEEEEEGEDGAYEVTCADVDIDFWGASIIHDLANDFAYPFTYDDEGNFYCTPKEELSRGALAEWLVEINFADELADFDGDKLEDIPFTDLSAEHEYAEHIMIMYEKGIINGYPDSTFKPEDTVNRAEMLTMLWGIFVDDEEALTELMDYEDSDSKPVDLFEDIDDDTVWYYPYLFYATKNGIIEGRSTTVEGEELRYAEMSSPILYAEAAKLVSLMRE